VRFSAAMHAACDVMREAYEAMQRAATALHQDKVDRGLPSGEAAPAGQVSLSHDRLVLAPTLPIGVMYEGLKHLCSRIVVISGEIGGRGVAYHDLAHEGILTDMYTAQEVFADATIPQHGELLITDPWPPQHHRRLLRPRDAGAPCAALGVAVGARPAQAGARRGARAV
jgi:hypothetical protein